VYGGFHTLGPGGSPPRLPSPCTAERGNDMACHGVILLLPAQSSHPRPQFRLLIPGAGSYSSPTLGPTYSRHLALSAPSLSLPLVPAPGIPQSDAHKQLQAIHPISRLRVPCPATPLATNNAKNQELLTGPPATHLLGTNTLARLETRLSQMALAPAALIHGREVHLLNYAGHGGKVQRGTRCSCPPGSKYGPCWCGTRTPASPTPSW
jgi:hypothetical protein